MAFSSSLVIVLVSLVIGSVAAQGPSPGPTPPPPPPPQSRPPPPPPPPSPPPPPPQQPTVCFPGDGKVEILGGKTKLMKHLLVGDKVASVTNDGEFLYSDIYAFGHKDPVAVTEFVHIKLDSGGMLELSPGHFIPIPSDAGIVYKRAEELKAGEVVWTTSNTSTLVVNRIIDVSRNINEGLFNPLTLSGTIIVNGVAASVHSEWFLDSIFDMLGASHLLPQTYQLLLTPFHILYKVTGSQIYSRGYAFIDGLVDIADAGTKLGGIAATAMVVVAAAKGRSHFN